MSPLSEIIDDGKVRDLEEHWRLLYVGLTRAAEHLVVAGVLPKRKIPADCWFERVRLAVESLGAGWQPDERWGSRLDYRGSVPENAIRPRAPRRPLASFAVPDWALRPAPPESRPPRPLAPSSLGEDTDIVAPPSAELRAAARRGILIHALLERLPGVVPDRRRTAALRWLEQSAGVASAPEREALSDLVCGVLDDDRFGALFGPGSLAEAPIAATLPDGRVIAGTVDRLLVAEGQVSVIDFKTGRVPASGADVPAPHRAQMAAYAEALSVIFPGHAIRAALLYTAEPRLIDLNG